MITGEQGVETPLRDMEGDQMCYIWLAHRILSLAERESRIVMTNVHLLQHPFCRLVLIVGFRVWVLTVDQELRVQCAAVVTLLINTIDKLADRVL